MVEVDEEKQAQKSSKCARVVSAILAHLNLLFVLYSGAMLATGARFKWDPSTYVALRELLPTEYQVACVLLPLASLTLLALAHLSLAALVTPTIKTRRTLYLIYSVCMSVVLLAEVVFVAWACVSVNTWLNSVDAQRMREALELRTRVMELLNALERLYPLPNQIKTLLQEAEADLPWNGYVACAAGVVLLVAQLAAVVLALLARSSLVLHSPQSANKTEHKMDRMERALIERERRERDQRAR